MQQIVFGMYYANINLAKLVGADVEVREVFGEMHRCISIPIDLNFLTEADGNVFLRVLISKSMFDKGNNSYYISLYMPTEERRKMYGYGYKPDLKFLGNMTVSYRSEGRKPKQVKLRGKSYILDSLSKE